MLLRDHPSIKRCIFFLQTLISVSIFDFGHRQNSFCHCFSFFFFSHCLSSSILKHCRGDCIDLLFQLLGQSKFSNRDVLYIAVYQAFLCFHYYAFFFSLVHFFFSSINRYMHFFTLYMKITAGFLRTHTTGKMKKYIIETPQNSLCL